MPQHLGEHRSHLLTILTDSVERSGHLEKVVS